jgi:hypothetical protein
MTEIKVDDFVNVEGGKWKGHTAQMTSIRPTYCQMRLIKDKQGRPIEGNKTAKVKKCYLKKVEPKPIEMPSADQLVNVDVNNEVSETLFETIDKKLMENKSADNKEVQEIIEVTELSPEEQSEVSDKNIKNSVSYIINENNVKSVALSMDDCENLQEENFKLKAQLESMLSFQADACKGEDKWAMILTACKEIADLKWLLKDLQEQLDDSVRLEHIEDLKNIINKL